ncbi:type VII secretion protein EccB [Lentzea sp. JNUCC 0626]|uniref:type VII secretion protein EccB n=1 Tax=Lentzea sp. JNUCC 0626 TaxID=3367513 RepID=UPI00374A4A7F
MQSRRDQVQAYFFVVGRLVAGLMQGRPDVLEHPNKRFNNGTVLGILLAGLLVAVFGIVGLFAPSGNNSWRADGTIVMEKETGARYVYVAGQLRPVLNTTSAFLAVGQHSKPVAVSRNSLTGVAVGAPIGIPGAPDGLPATDRLNTGEWTVCARPPDGSSVASPPTVTVHLGQPAVHRLAGDKGLVVVTPDKTSYLVWKGSRYRITEKLVLEALGYDAERMLTVAPAWLNTIRAGADLKAPVIAGVGEPGATVSGRPGRVGQLYEVDNPTLSSVQFYVLTGNGLLPVSRTVAAMLVVAPATKAAYPGEPVRIIKTGPDVLASVQLAAGALGTDLPQSPPDVADVDEGMLLCMNFSGSPGEGGTLVTVPRSAETTAVAPAGKTVEGATADHFVIPAGLGALVTSSPAPGVTGGTEYLITDLGVKFPLANDSVGTSLGYGNVSRRLTSPVLLNLLPTGPALDPAFAVTERLISP